MEEERIVEERVKVKEILISIKKFVILLIVQTLILII